MSIEHSSLVAVKSVVQSEAPLILIADDEPINRKLIQRRLERERYRVITAEDGQEAVDLTKSRLPDLVLLDVMMEVKINGFALGANDYISKPFKAEELLARVNVALRIKQERDRLRSTVEEAIAEAEVAHERAMTDALTGLFNRYGLQRALTREMAEARRYSRPFSCLMFDVDNFKIVNDSFGHPTGDVAIRQVSQILGEAIRRSDMIFRYGGEEFLALLPETNLTGARALAEKVRLLAEERIFGSAEKRFHLTLSIGAAEMYQHESGNDMIARADMALYYAKEHGRNRVETAE